MAGKDKKVKHVIILDDAKDEDELSDEELDEPVRVRRKTDTGPSLDDDEDDDEESALTEGLTAGKKKKRMNRRIAIRLLFLLVSLIILGAVVIFAMTGVGNDYRTPVAVYEEYLNKDGYSSEDLAAAYGNGLAERGLRKLRKKLRQNQAYMDDLYSSMDESHAVYEDNRARYGDDFKYRVTINIAEPLSASQCNSYTADFAGLMNDIGRSWLAGTGDAKVTSALFDLTSSLEDARVTRGYRLYCTESVTGTSKDGPVNEAFPIEITVVKIKGRWIMWDGIYDIFRMAY
ncbi:MAG: hypothetical protein K6F34_04505 [Lachnospiraceae bacterium]|nr:hypothetical protein [Lachnospiraceae bacterium]